MPDEVKEVSERDIKLAAMRAKVVKWLPSVIMCIVCVAAGSLLTTNKHRVEFENLQNEVRAIETEAAAAVAESAARAAALEAEVSMQEIPIEGTNLSCSPQRDGSFVCRFKAPPGRP